jgi:pimeloyl-ACP methyl ester carboxylesterase
MSVLPTAISKGEGEPALVLLHGVGSDASIWQYQLDHFGRSRKTVAWNMPGFGDSPPLSPMTWPGLVESLERLLDAQGLKRVVLLGHSLGGFIAQKFAEANPERLAGLILSGTTASFGKPDGEWQQEFVRQRLAPFQAGKTMKEIAPDVVRAVLGPKASPEGADLAVHSAMRVSDQAFQDAVRLIVTFDGREALARLDLPVLLLAGEVDNNAPAGVMRKMVDRIKGARIVEFPGLGHMANIEDALAFDAAVEAFLNDHFRR